MVERGLVSGFFELSLFGPLDGGVNAFLIIKGNGRLTFCEHPVRERPAFVEDGHAAAKGFTDGDLAVFASNSPLRGAESGTRGSGTAR